MTAENKKENLQIFLFSFFGAVISVLSFLIYHYCNHTLITITLCIADVVYAYFNARIFLKSKNFNEVRQFLIPLFLLVYWTIVFAVIIIGNAALLEREFSNNFFLYPIFLMPSFALVLLLLALVASGL